VNLRIVARACITAGLLCIIGTVVLAGLPGRHVWPLGFSTCASGILAIGGGLTYLRSTVKAAVSHDTGKSDLAAWQSARTLADLGELTARWIEGGLASQPGYCGPSDIEDRALVPLLAALNRAGFVTTGSQIGESGPGYDGAHWQQRAAVEGFAGPEMTSALIVAANDTGLTIVVRDPAGLPRWRYRYDRSVTVTMREDRKITGFGVQLPRRHIRDSWLGYGICHRDAVDALCSAWQVTVIDPEWGRADLLWRVLEQAVRPAGGAP
jgi:hypothetical protein